MRLIILSIILISFTTQLRAQEDELEVFTSQGNKWLQFSNAHHSLDLHLAQEAYQLLQEREDEVELLQSKEEVESRKRELFEIMDDLMGPERHQSSLNPKITNTLDKKDYRLELIRFESLPGFYVTGSLFIPKGIKQPAPAILFCSGHSGQAYRRDLYQIPLLNLVKKGFIVFAIDPIGQGERLQYYDEQTGKSVIGSSTKEHSYPMPQLALTGESIARFFVQDGIKAIDYLISRSEVDSTRIGVHGLSGGGTQTAYIAALDKRVKASAPAGYITNYRRIFQSIGVQDGEQNLYRGIVNGIDHPELLMVRAPKPTLLMATTRDFFSIEGTRETFAEVKKIYSLYDQPGHIELVEGDYGHGYTKNTREAMYGFFQKYLNNPGNKEEEEVELLPEDEIKITPTGQVSTSFPQSETVFSLNKKKAEIKLMELESKRKNPLSFLPEVVEEAKNLSGFIPPRGGSHPVFMGRLGREGYVIEKYFISGEGDYAIPYLMFIPNLVNGKAVIYLDPKGKSASSGIGGEVEALVKNGFTVLAPDLLGIGELAPRGPRGDAYIDNISYNSWFASMAIGRSILGIQAADVLRLFEILEKEKDINQVNAVAKGKLAPVLLHAAAFEGSMADIALIKPFLSYESMVKNEFYTPELVYSIVPGALLKYDLPDLAATLAPRKLLMTGIVNSQGNKIQGESLKQKFSIIYDSYQDKGALNNLKVNSVNSENPTDLLTQFFTQ